MDPHPGGEGARSPSIEASRSPARKALPLLFRSLGGRIRVWLDPKRPGVYSEPIPDAQAVHNLEHSHVWLSYRDPSDTTTVAALAAIAARHPGVILVSPRPANDAPIAVAAWGRLLKLQTVDGEQIERFITDSLHKGPEDVPMQGV